MPVGGRWTRVDATNRPPCLDADDLCFYLHEYVPHAGYAYSDANQLVINYKIPITELRRNPARRRYKDEAIDMFPTRSGTSSARSR